MMSLRARLIKRQQSFLQLAVGLENPTKYTVEGKMCTVSLLFIVTIGDIMWTWSQPKQFFTCVDNANHNGIILRD